MLLALVEDQTLSSQRIESFKPDWRSDKIYGITTDPLIIPGSPFLRTLSGLRF